MALTWNTSDKDSNPKAKNLVLTHQNSCQIMKFESPYIEMYYGIFPLGYLHLIRLENS